MKKRNTRITLYWMNKIRERLKEKYDSIGEWKHAVNVMDFIQPVLDYGNVAEIRITKSFHKTNYHNCRCSVCRKN